MKYIFFKTILAVIFLSMTIKPQNKLSNYDIEAISVTSAVSIIGYDLCSGRKNSLIRSAIYVGLLAVSKKLDEDKFPLCTCCTALGIIGTQAYLELKNKRLQ